MSTRISLVGVALAILILAAPLQAGPDKRPHSVKAFRSVLDKRARIVTVPLHEDMWLGYEATGCGLYKAWTGDVKLDGAVYTTVHGPQPTARGANYIVDTEESVWRVGFRGKPMQSRVRYMGYRFEGENVTLRYEIGAQDRRRRLRVKFRVEETPTFSRDPKGRPVLERSFTIEGMPPGVMLALRGSVRGCTSVEDISSDATLRAEVTGERPVGEGTLLDIETNCIFDENGTKHIRYAFEKPIVVIESERAAARAAKEKAAQAAREGLEKDPIPPHPSDTPLGNGVSVRVYEVGTAMAQLRELVPGQTPNYSHVLPVLDLRTERGDFGKAADTFITHVDGFLQVERAGAYAFQLVSDDGSRLYLDDKLVVDHDGLHGPTEMSAKTTLTKGRHKLFAEHFENGGGEQLTLKWKPPGAEAFEVVPNAALRAPTGEVRVTSPGKKKLVPIARRGRPGDGQPLTGVHPAYDLMTVRPEGFEPRVGGMDWLPDGRLLICCWEPRGGVYAIDGVRGDDRAKIATTCIAEGLAEPLGLRVVDGRIFVLQKQELTELIDHDGDGITDEYRCVAAGWGVTANFHEFAFGLVYKDEHFYAALATAINPGGASTQPQDPDRGKVVKIEMDGGGYDFVAEGLRTPNGIGLGVDGEIFITDNQGDWLPVSKVLHLSDEAFFGSRSVDPEGTRGREVKLPVVWLPQGEIGNSPGEPGLLRHGPYAGQMVHCDVTHGGLKRVFVEKVDGAYQGCVFRFTQGLEAGINRFTHGPDGAIYVGGIGSAGNWGQTGKRKHGLQRLRYNGSSVFEMLRVKAYRNGLEVEFTEPLETPAGLAPADFTVQQWRYEPTKDYGGPKIDLRDLAVRQVQRANRPNKIFLDVPGLLPGHVVYLRLARTVRGKGGRTPWSTEAWYTLNALPDRAHVITSLAEPRAPNTLTDVERAVGWRLLFDGRSTEAWRGFKKKELPGAWAAEGGALTFDPKRAARGDIVTKAQFKNYVLELEWKISQAGNSGIMFHVGEEHGAPWATGPEMQVLDNDGHPDGRGNSTSAGANYALHPPRFDVTRPPGRWNRVRLVVDGTHIQHWMNGWKLLEYELGSPAWKALVKKSKFAGMPAYGTRRSGHISLQDHGDAVSYRNIRILPMTR